MQKNQVFFEYFFTIRTFFLFAINRSSESHNFFVNLYKKEIKPSPSRRRRGVMGRVASRSEALWCAKNAACAMTGEASWFAIHNLLILQMKTSPAVAF